MFYTASSEVAEYGKIDAASEPNPPEETSPKTYRKPCAPFEPEKYKINRRKHAGDDRSEAPGQRSPPRASEAPPVIDLMERSRRASPKSSQHRWRQEAAVRPISAQAAGQSAAARKEAQRFPPANARCPTAPFASKSAAGIVALACREPLRFDLKTAIDSGHHTPDASSATCPRLPEIASYLIDGATERFSRREFLRLLDITISSSIIGRSSASFRPQSRRRRLYDFRDLISLRTAKQLIQSGVSANRLRLALAALNQKLSKVEQPLTDSASFERPRRDRRSRRRPPRTHLRQFVLNFDTRELRDKVRVMPETQRQ